MSFMIYTIEMELWHVLNRGVDGRYIFIDSQDYARFVHDLYEFNDRDPVENQGRFFENSRMKDIVSPSSGKTRKLLVDIHGWVLMKNHYHLLLTERVEGGKSLFLRKLNVGYARYFNERHGRVGTLFQGRTKKILVKRQAHYLYILQYIHLNPLDYLKGAEKWRVRSKTTLRNAKEALEYLDSYRWSSYLDYMGHKNFPSILTKSLFQNSVGEHGDAIKQYLNSAVDDEQLIELILE